MGFYRAMNRSQEQATIIHRRPGLTYSVGFEFNVGYDTDRCFSHAPVRSARHRRQLH
jgi:hypothetical protein